MPKERYAKWDTMKLPYGFNEAYIEPPNTVEAERARRRVAPFEEYLALLQEAEDAQRLAIARSPIARETKRRLAYWKRPGQSMGASVGRILKFSVPRVLAILTVLTAGWLLILYVPAGPIPICGMPSWFSLVLVVLSMAGLIFAIVRRPAASDTTSVASERRACLDCGYDLRETRPAIDPNELDGQWTGPRACPECGAPWPMLPPPVFDG